ncbi:MAG: tetratricopeptide repeat protein, partial [Candidatus Methylomirabilales bacterium]
MGNSHDEAVAQHSLGLDYAGKGELDRAQEAFERALRLRPDYVEAHYDLARLQATRGAWDRAVAAFERVLELTPDFAQAYSELGLALVALGRSGEAITAFESALRWKPDDPFAMTDLAVSLQERGESHKARDLFEEALRIAPWMEEAYQGLTGILVAAGNLGEAEAVLLAGEKAVVDAGKRARLQLSIGFLRAEQGRLAEAMDWFQTSLR